MSTRINTPMAEAGSGGSDDEETPAPIVVAANNKSSMTMKKKPRKPTKGGGGAARAPTRPHPEAHEHGAAVLIQARTRGNRDRTQNDFYKDKDTISSHTNATMDWLRGRCTEQREKIDKKRLHFFDYWKKYDGDDKMQPSQKLKTIGTPWCMMFTLTEDDETGEYDRLSYECVELCQRCWAADLYLDASLSSTKREVAIKLGAPYEILAQEAQEMGLLMRLKETKGAVPCAHYSWNNLHLSLGVIGLALACLDRVSLACGGW